MKRLIGFCPRKSAFKTCVTSPTALSGSKSFKPPALPEVPDSPGKKFCRQFIPIVRKDILAIPLKGSLAALQGLPMAPLILCSSATGGFLHPGHGQIPGHKIPQIFVHIRDLDLHQPAASIRISVDEGMDF